MTAPRPSLPAARRRALAAISVALLAFAGAVCWGRWQLERQWRAQLLEHDAVALQILAQREITQAAAQDPEFDLAAPTSQYAVLLGMADLTNIIAARVFDSAGAFVAGIPAEVKEATLSEATLTQLGRLTPLTRYRPAAPVHELFLYLPDPTKPRPVRLTCPDAPRTELFLELANLEAPGADRLTWVEVYIPLYRAGEDRLLGVAQFMLEGSTLEREFATLRRRLNRQAALLLGTGFALIGGGLGWAFGRLERVNRQLAARSADLQRANQALADAARSAAVGAVAAHLIHSLKNPVAGLHSFVTARQDNVSSEESAEWREALAATRRMQHLIHEVIEVLQERENAPTYAVNLAELGEALADQCRALATCRDVRLVTRLETSGEMDNHTAGLLRLILANLIQNALEASPPGRSVTLLLRRAAAGFEAEVRDEGPGLPETVQDRLFEPVRSTKEGGSGIGLAIAYQLAHHLGATLQLVSTSPAGTTFRVTLPHHRWMPQG